jgi:hypothetical protein
VIEINVSGNTIFLRVGKCSCAYGASILRENLGYVIHIKSSSTVAEKNSQETFVPSQCAGSYLYKTE